MAERLASLLPGSEPVFVQGNIRRTLTQAWHRYDHLICIMAAGIVVRSIAPLLQDKRTDPAVVVCDEQGQFAVSLLSGHLGGGNALARTTAELLGGQAVITTASDVLGRTALDIWCRDNGLAVPDKQGLTRVMAKLVNSGSVSLFSEYSEYPPPALPPDIILCRTPDDADLLISCRTGQQGNSVLLHPKKLALGIGCNRNTPAEEIRAAVEQTCADNRLALHSVCILASIDLKNDEPGLLAFAAQQGLEIEFHSPARLNSVEGVEKSAAVRRATGAKAVAEPAAVLSSGNGPLLVRKIKFPNVTVAIAEMQEPWRRLSCGAE